MSPFELPAARSGRRPMRLQMRTGFCGPSSRTSASGLAHDRAAVVVARVVERGRAPDHTLARDAVQLLADRPHEVAAAARGDVVREPVRLQVAQAARPSARTRTRDSPRPSVGCCADAQERVRLRLEVVDADSRVRGEHAAEERAHVRVVAGVVLGHAPRPARRSRARTPPSTAAVAQLGIRLGHLGEPAQDEVGLDRQRLLAPQRAVVVEDGDALLGRHVRPAVTRSTKSRTASCVGPSFQEASGSPRQRPAVSAASSFSTAWSIVKLAAFCRGGNSSNVARNCVDDGRRGEDEVGVVEHPVVVGVRGDVGALERVGAQVEELRHAQRDERLGPDLQRPLHPLLHEDDLPVVEPQREHVAVVGEVDEPLPRALVDLAGQVRQQVVAVDVDLEGRVADSCARLQLLDDVRLAGGGEERRQPVVVLDDLVRDRARLRSCRASGSSRGRGTRLPSSCSSRSGTASCRRPARCSCAGRCRCE